MKYDVNDKDNKIQPDSRIINKRFGQNDENQARDIAEAGVNASQGFQVR